jgi:photosystem II stability/assembly factor-like uncharacterized protein
MVENLMILLALIVLIAQASAAQEHAIYKSVDRGLTWSRADGNLPGQARINSFGAIGDRITAGTDEGIYWSSDEGRTWRRSNSTARALSFATSGPVLFAGTHKSGLLASEDGGVHWRPVPGLASRNVRSLAAVGGRLYAGTDSDGVMVSRDQGATWSGQSLGLPPMSQIFAMAVVDGTVFAGLYAKGIFALRESERRWVEFGQAQPLVLADAGGRLAAGHNPGGIYWNENPRAAEWRKAAGDFGATAPVWAMGSGGGLVLAGVAEGIFRSEDGGRSWARVTKGLPAGSSGVSFLVRGDMVYAGLVMQTAGRPARE